MTQDIPLINVESLGQSVESSTVISEIENACRNVGFMYVTGHGIKDETITNLRDATIRYFAQSDAVKSRDIITRDNYRGYIPLNFFTPNSGSTDADCYEGYKLHFEVAADDQICSNCTLYGPNKWPASQPGLRSAVEKYWQQCDRLTMILLRVFAKLLSTAEAEFLDLFLQPLSNMTLLHYPSLAGVDAELGIHPHKDTDALTILAPEPVGGLQVWRRDDSAWIDVRPPEDALIVNIGDLLEVWSGGYLVSAPHRVVNISGKHRYSFPFFAVPRYDTVVSPLHADPENFNRELIHVGDASHSIWSSNWPDAAAVDRNIDPGFG